MPASFGGVGTNTQQQPGSSFAQAAVMRGESSTTDYNGLITQAAIEHACQLTVERSRHEFLAGLHE
jgi:hypothetical protein